MASAHILEIIVHKATGLKDVAWFGMNQDPYVSARAMPSEKEVKTGSIWGGGVNPIWDREKHHSRLLMKVKPSDTQLVLDIRNKNTMMPDELIGSASLDLAAVIETDAVDSETPMQLPVSNGGTLVCTVCRRTSANDRDLQEALNRSMNPNFWDASNLTGGSSNGSSGGSSTSGGGATLGGATAPQGASERRAAAAAAAEARQQDWRQGGSKDTAKGAAVAQRRQKDDLIGKIEAAYSARGEDPPFGLNASSLEVLQKHLAMLKDSTTNASSRQQKEAKLAAAVGLK